jgi:hypothetical protein
MKRILGGKPKPITTTPIPASATAALQAEARERVIRNLRVDAQARFNETGLPRYLYSTRVVAR